MFMRGSARFAPGCDGLKNAPKRTGGQGVAGSNPVIPTNLRSPTSSGELRLASQFHVCQPQSEQTGSVGEGCPPKRRGREGGRQRSCSPHCVAAVKRFVYILQSESDPRRFYTGLTSNVRVRLAAHNRGECSHTANGLPWKPIVVVAFTSEERAVAFSLAILIQNKVSPGGYRTAVSPTSGFTVP
jgi:putative endonuclease